MRNNKIITFIFILIIIISIVLTGIKIETNLTKNRINKYINDNSYKQEKYNIYTLTKKENNNETIYQLLYDNYYFSKYTLNNISEDETIKTKYYFTTNKEIIIEYENSIINDNGLEINSLRGTFKNNSLKNCEIIIGKNKSCDILKDYAINYNNEINIILENYNINPMFLKIEK